MKSVHSITDGESDLLLVYTIEVESLRTKLAKPNCRRRASRQARLDILESRLIPELQSRLTVAIATS